MSGDNQYLLDAVHFDALLAVLHGHGYETVGPRLRDGAIIYDTLQASAELPIGWRDTQDRGQYRLEKSPAPHDRAFFDYVVGPHAWKKYLFPAQETLWQVERDGAGFRAVEATTPAPKRAFIGVRACELHAIAIQDRVFTGGTAADPHPVDPLPVDPKYAARRDNIFTVAVNCGRTGGNCFCVSMNTGPRVDAGFDLALTELLDAHRHVFLIEAGSAAGAEILAELPTTTATDSDRQQAEQLLDATTSAMGRVMDTQGIQALLYDNAEHPRWEETAQRCVSCGNCTSVCPTCFCSEVEDVTSLDGEQSRRERRWASCFTQSFTHMAGGSSAAGISSRVSTASRYRHWLTHKLAGWIDQFGTSGCVGCGRCITWCPPGIDLTEEVAAIRSQPDGAKSSTPEMKP